MMTFKLKYPRLYRTVLEAAGVTAVGFAVGVANNLFSPQNIPLLGDWSKDYGVPSAGGAHAATYGNVEIDLQEAVRLHREGAFFIDARPPEDYAAEHIPGAHSMPEERDHEIYEQLLAELAPDAIVVTYCQSMNCDEAHLLARSLREAGITNVYVFAGGLKEWLEENNPVQGNGAMGHNGASIPGRQLTESS
jgi:rhodanese-related sulfurtransferase